MSSGVFKSPAAERRVLASYDRVLSHWDLPLRGFPIETRRGETHVIATGANDKPPLVLLHGGGGNAAMWYPNVEALSRERCVYALDIPGEMGKSVQNRFTFTAYDDADWLADVLDGLKLASADILGASLGGSIALRFAFRYPDRVARVMAACPPSIAKPRLRLVLRAILLALMPTRGNHLGFYRFLTSKNGRPPEPWALEDLVTRGLAQKTNAHQIPLVDEDMLAALPLQTLLFLGADDPFFAPDPILNKVVAVAPFIQTQVVPNAGHIPSVEQPAVFNEAVLEFLKQDIPDSGTQG